MSSSSQLYAVMPVSDSATALEWYATLFGRPADEVIGGEALWQVSDSAWIVVDEQRDRAGGAQVTIGTGGLDEIPGRLAERGIDHEPVETYGNGVRHVVITDPDGNRLALAAAP